MTYPNDLLPRTSRRLGARSAFASRGAAPFGGALLLAIATCATACGVFGASDSGSSSDPAPVPSTTPPVADAEPGKAPVINGTPDSADINETLGVFVAPTGVAGAPGTRAQPLASIQAGIALGKASSRRVYVCTGTYLEALTLADSIAVIGGLDCSAAIWKTGAPRTRVEAPTSPAIVAKNITTVTRVEALDVLAPQATQAGGSSIGLLAEKAGALVIANSKITASDAAKGDDGAEGIQLVQGGTLNGQASPVKTTAVCSSLPPATCAGGFGPNWIDPPSGAGGTSVCAGAPGHDGEAGGKGGTGGLMQVYQGQVVINGVPTPTLFLKDYLTGAANTSHPATLGQARAGGPTAAGVDGPNAAVLGTFSSQGYTPSDGTSGTDGSPGKGGSGEDGTAPSFPVPAGAAVGDAVRGISGAGGGAGGCPGLAGSAGKGGGASIAALLTDSPMTFDNSELVAGKGGDPGHGTLGSLPTPGGTAPLHAGSDGAPAGFSGNGSAGPSIGIAHAGAAPILGTSKVTPGVGGAAIDLRTRGATTIPATPAGLSKDVLLL
jgi:hypothetical protein